MGSGRMTESAAAERILAATAAATGVPREQLVGTERTQAVTDARHVAMYAIRQQTNLSFPRIGMLFGKNHSTVIAAVRRVESTPQLLELVRRVQCTAVVAGDVVRIDGFNSEWLVLHVEPERLRCQSRRSGGIVDFLPHVIVQVLDYEGFPSPAGQTGR